MVRRITLSLSRILMLVICAGALTGSLAKPTASQPRDTVATRTYYPEARMRKMHLVRPDLILYPIFYDVYC